MELALLGIAEALLLTWQAAPAVVIWGWLDHLWAAAPPLNPVERAEHATLLADARQRLTAVEFDASWGQGQALTLAELLVCSRSDRAQSPASRRTLRAREHHLR